MMRLICICITVKLLTNKHAQVKWGHLLYYNGISWLVAFKYLK